MARMITVDPITRIEGHLRIDVEVDRGKVQNSWSSGQMWRGIEKILEGRDPRDAWIFTQRICGVCTTVHAIASVRSVENALQINPPLNAQLIRNILISAHALHDHIVHFYHLSALDWVDVVSALKGNPKTTSRLAESLSPWPGNGVKDLTAVKEKLADFVSKGQLGIFTNGYWGHPAMDLPPDVNLLAVSHYLQALEVQKTANKVVTVLGSKTPNIQNLAVGGVANAINLDNEATLNMAKLYQIKGYLEEVRAFIDQVYFTDVAAIGAMYAPWLGYGAGVTNYLSVPDLPLNPEGTEFGMPGGVIMNGDLGSFREISSFNDELFRDNVAESIAHSWYEGDGDLHPWQGETVPAYSEFDHEGKYSWVKSPRFEGQPMQVGPLAQVLAGLAAGDELTTKFALEFLDVAGSVAGVKLTPAVLHSTLGRHAARAIRARVIAHQAVGQWEALVGNIGGGDTEIFTPFEFPTGEIQGFGFHEAPRGTLSHWCVIDNGKIKNYQCVVPSTWNAGPRDGDGQLGPYEASLVGNPIADPERPLEVLRTVHSFDPCLACAIHTHDADGKERS
ncbi:MAG: nickel-dependent hydrogenase large subunit, partial [Acidobacteria bacterium]|nr:nickel-dependent hydrogenase large subunit [Candidatus Sulfomarinibacter sp. MAG AM2]